MDSTESGPVHPHPGRPMSRARQELSRLTGLAVPVVVTQVGTMLMGVVGHVQKSDGVIHLIARDIVDLSHWLGSMELSSRDFT